MDTLFHITSQTETTTAQAQGWYEPTGFVQEGFMHCSFLSQVIATASRYYQHQSDLVLLEIDPALLSCEVRVENLLGGQELFPHVYGRLPWLAVRQVHPFPCEVDGGFRLPKEVA